MMRLAVLASGRGTNLQALQDSILQERVAARIALVLSNVPASPAVSAARAAGIPVWTAAHSSFASREDFDLAMLRAMDEAKIDAVVLAGYMRLLSSRFIQAYAGRILNIHPSLLPAFAGAQGVADALEYGVRFAGCSVHFVTEEMDAGPLIIQSALSVSGDESKEDLLAYIQKLEHRIYPQALQWLAQGRLRIHGRKVRLLPPDRAQDEARGKTPAATYGMLPEGPAYMICPGLEEGF